MEALVEPLLALSGICKSFPGVVALQDVALDLRAGEVTALLGENGAGKSTLVKVLTGIERPDSGDIHVAGRAVSFATPRDAWAAGIAAIHQETASFDELSVAENVFMGHFRITGAGLLSWRMMRRRTMEILRELDADFDPDVLLGRLSVAQKHLVGVARALSHDSRIMIMDEPTAALSSREVDELFRVVSRLKAQGRAILFISHKFEEVYRIADRWMCLRDGRDVGSGVIRDTTPGRLVKLMVGRTIEEVFPKRPVRIGAPLLEVEGLSNPTEFADLSFVVHAGEIVGFYGLVGSGRSEAMQALFGVSRGRRGTIRVRGRPMDIRSPAQAIAAGIAYVPEDRQTQGAVLPFGIRLNTTLASLVRHSPATFLARGRELDTTREMGRRFSVKAHSWEQPLRELSGGNQQKVILGKWLATRPTILILDEPTKGVDVGSKAAVHALMGELAASGLGIVLVSSELPEVMGMSDTILVMHEGRIVRRFTRAEATAEAILTAATGTAEAAAA